MQSKEKKLMKSNKKTSIVGWSLLLLFQVPPPTQECGEGVPIDKVKKQGTTMNNNAVKQQWGGAQKVLEKGK
jgi:hypothetical protein